MIWHNATASEVLDELLVDDKQGLSSAAAEERLKLYGKNILSSNEKSSLIKHFLSQLTNTATIALIIISIISYILSLLKDVPNAYFSLLIIAIVLFNAFIGAFHSHRAENELSHIRSVTNSTVSVLRDGILKSVNSAMLVPGDIVFLDVGDYIPADARIIDCNEFRVNEYALTEVDVPVQKNGDLLFEDITPIANRLNMVWAGTSVVHGQAKIVVTETNIDTEIGRSNAILAQSGGDDVPLNNQLDSVSKVINYIVLAFCVVVFFVGFFVNFKTQNFANMTVDMLLNSLALAVTAIPEGLTPIVVIVLSFGFARILKNKAIIKDPTTAVALAETDVLCCDKTGVFTHNKMSLRYIFSHKGLVDTTCDSISDTEALAIKLATACSTLENDHTESAIEKACLVYNSMSRVDIDSVYPHIAEIPFDKDRKTMTVITMINERPFAIVKGAAEKVITKCVDIKADEIFKINEQLTNDAMRVVCIAIKPLVEIPANPTAEEIESGLTFVALLGLDDPIRSSVIKDVEFINNIGIKPVMLTGDNLLTAKAVARRIGILKDGTLAITGDELNLMSDEELQQNIDKYTVFARISSNDKVRIVKAFKANGLNVTITGNRIEDADAIALADVGCAIGKFGADATVGNADIIIKNNRFETIVKTIKETRGIFVNIKKSILYLLGCNLAEILTVLLGLIIFGGMPVSALQLLWINLLTDSAPALALGMETPYDSDVRGKGNTLASSIFNGKTISYILSHSIYITVISLIAFAIGGGTLAFATLIFMQICNCYNSKFFGTIFNKCTLKNSFMNMSCGVIAVLTILLCVTPFGAVFGLSPLSFGKLLVALGFGLTVVPFAEIIKRFIKL